MQVQTAARYHGREDVRIEQVDVLALQPGEVQVKVAFAGICGSDLHESVFGCVSSHPRSANRWCGASLPQILGHEFSGTITGIGAEVDASRLAIGTNVCIEPVISCGTCEPCRSGSRPLCAKGLAMFGYNRPGGLASYVNVDQANVHVVPENVPLDIAALAEPLSVAWHAVRRSGLKEGQTALVLGAGPIGAMVTKVLKAQGASWVAVSEPNAARADIARLCGADAIYNPQTVDVVAATRAATGGGVDISLDCAGSQQTFDAAIAATKPLGCIVMVALWTHAAQLDIVNILFGEKTVTASVCFAAKDMREVLEALRTGYIRVDDLITSRISLRDLVDSGFRTLKSKAEHVKILVDMAMSSG